VDLGALPAHGRLTAEIAVADQSGAVVHRSAFLIQE
jgi:hypothetical protein